MALHKKFKTKKDLYNYMTHSRKYQTQIWLFIVFYTVNLWLPEYDQCRLSYL